MAKLWVNSLWRLAQVLGNGAFAAVYLLIYTRAISKEAYGTYGVALTLALLFNIVGVFGMQRAVAWFVARSRGRGELAQAAESIGAALRLGAMFSAGAAVLFGLCTVVFPGTFASWSASLLAALGVYIAGKSLSFTLQGALEGAGHFRQLSITTFALNAVQLVVVLTAWWWGLSIARIITIEAAATLGEVLLYGAQVRALRRSYAGPTDDARHERRLLRFGLPLMLNAAAGFLYGRVDLLFVDHYLSQSAAADYFLMLSLFDFPLMLLGAYIYVLNTEVSVWLGQGRVRRIRRLFWRSEAMGVGLGVALMVVFFGASHLVGLWLPEYEAAAGLMRIASPLLMVKCISQIASGAFIVSLGRPAVLATLTAIGGALNVALNFVLVPTYGLEGAVYSTLLGHTLMGALTFAYVVRLVRRLA